jgi:hypothetical protein
MAPATAADPHQQCRAGRRPASFNSPGAIAGRLQPRWPRRRFVSQRRGQAGSELRIRKPQREHIQFENCRPRSHEVVPSLGAGVLTFLPEIAGCPAALPNASPRSPQRPQLALPYVLDTWTCPPSKSVIAGPQPRYGA